MAMVYHAGNDGELKAWSIDESVMKEKLGAIVQEGHHVLQERGTLYRHGRDRPLSVSFHPKRDLITVHGSEKAVEILRIRSESEIRKFLARKRKRRKEKATAADADSEWTSLLMMKKRRRHLQCDCSRHFCSLCHCTDWRQSKVDRLGWG